MTLKLGTLGNGAWGSALSTLAAQAGHDVLAWGRAQDLIAEAPYQQTDSFEDLRDCEVLIIALPVKILPEILPQVAAAGVCPKYIVVVSKGLDPETGGLLSDRIESVFKTSDYCALSGPNLAHEIHQGLPAATSLYCPDAAWPMLSTLFPQKSLRLYHCQDKIGVQLGGALKNVIAIATGFCHGFGLGRNLESTLITRGLHEIMRLGQVLGAHPQTFYGLSGMGDMVLTCSGPASRNFRFGMLLAQGGQSVEDLVADIGTVEGLFTCQSLQKLLEKTDVDLPLCQAVYDVLFNKVEAKQVIDALLSRPLKAEGV